MDRVMMSFGQGVVSYGQGFAEIWALIRKI